MTPYREESEDERVLSETVDAKFKCTQALKRELERIKKSGKVKQQSYGPLMRLYARMGVLLHHNKIETVQRLEEVINEWREAKAQMQTMEATLNQRLEDMERRLRQERLEDIARHIGEFETRLMDILHSELQKRPRG